MQGLFKKKKIKGRERVYIEVNQFLFQYLICPYNTAHLFRLIIDLTTDLML